MVTLHKLFETYPAGPSYQVMKTSIRETPPKPTMLEQEQDNMTWAPTKRSYKRKQQESETPPSAMKRTLVIDIEPEPESVPQAGKSGGLLKTAQEETSNTTPVIDDRE